MTNAQIIFNASQQLAEEMVAEMVEFLQETELIDENGDLDEINLDSICNQMAISYQEEEDDD